MLSCFRFRRERSDCSDHSARTNTEAKGINSWLRIGFKGDLSTIEADKSSLSRTYGIPGRDLSLFDSGLEGPCSGPSAIVFRGAATLISLEAIRVVIGQQDVCILSAPKRGELGFAATPTSDNAFVRDLVLRLRPEARLLPLDHARYSEDPTVDRSLPWTLRALEGVLSGATGLLCAEAATFQAANGSGIRRTLNGQISSKELHQMHRLKQGLRVLLLRLTSLQQVLLSAKHSRHVFLGAAQGRHRTSVDGGRGRSWSSQHRSQKTSKCLSRHGSTAASTQQAVRHFDSLYEHGSSDGSGKLLREVTSLLEAYALQADGAIAKASLALRQATDVQSQVAMMHKVRRRY